MPSRARAVLPKLPFLRSVERRRRVVRVVRATKALRRRSFEALGSSRFSRLGEPAVEAALHRYIDFRDGFFVEAGANDGIRQSNTYFLERVRGWRGLLVEPIPELAERCRAQRPRAIVVNCALVAPEDAGGRVRLRYADLGSTAASEAEYPFGGPVNYGWDETYEVDVPGRTITGVLDEHDVSGVDLLSLDVEGWEVPALEGLNLERHAPRYVLVEAWTHERLAQIRELLGSRYELVELFTDHDAFFRRIDQWPAAHDR